MLLSKIQEFWEQLLNQNVPTDWIDRRVGASIRSKAQDDFLAIGLLLKSFYIASLKPSEKSAEELRAMGMLDMNVYTQLQAADALRDAAQNPNGGAGLTAGIGAGVGLGNIISQAYGTNAQQQAPAAAAPVENNVMTPSEVAQLLKVSEEDVMAAIQAGDLKARKIGSAYRISKDSVDEFLKG